MNGSLNQWNYLDDKNVHENITLNQALSWMEWLTLNLGFFLIECTLPTAYHAVCGKKIFS